VGCVSTPVIEQDKTMTPETAQLVGYWEKTSVSRCSQVYPEHIDFRKNGRYLAQNSPESPQIVWNVGSYQVEGLGQLRAALANDASELYRFSLSNDVLTLVDSTNCEVSYRKVK